MMVGVRIAMLIELSNIPELFFAYIAVEWSEGFRDLGLDECSTSDTILSFRPLIFTLLEKTLRSQFAAL